MKEHPNADIIRVKLKEIKTKHSRKGGLAKDLHYVTVDQLIDQVDELLDTKPRPVYVANEAN